MFDVLKVPRFHRFVCTVLSSPSVIIITKKMIAKKVEPIMFAMASGYVMKSKLGPGKLGNNIYDELRVRSG